MHTGRAIYKTNKSLKSFYWLFLEGLNGLMALMANGKKFGHFTAKGKEGIFTVKFFYNCRLKFDNFYTERLMFFNRTMANG